MNEVDAMVERIADAADRASECFMDRYRRRPHGDGELMYGLSDALSTFASELRSPPETTTP